MARLFRFHTLLPMVAVCGAAMVGGCVAYPAYPTYGYGYPQPYGGSYVAIGGGWHDGGWRGGGWHDDGWRGGGWRGGGWRR